MSRWSLGANVSHVNRAFRSAALAGVLLGACRSNAAKTNVSTATTVVTPVASCPFNGSLETVAFAGPGTPTATLTGIVTSSSGCVDQVRLNFDPALVPATIGYDVDTTGITSTTTPGTTRLVVKLGGPAVANASPGASRPASSIAWNDAPVPVPPALNHVRQLDVQPGTLGELDVFIVVNARVPFTTSTSASPPYLVVGIGAST